MYKVFVVLSILFTVNYGSAFSQKLSDSEHLHCSIYEPQSTGSAKICFDNLFSNWGPRYITNFEDVRLVGYNYLLTVSDSGSIDSTIEKVLLGPETAGLMVTKGGSVVGSTDKKNSHCIVEVRKNKDPLAGLNEEAISSARRIMTNTVHLGDEVYAVHLKSNNEDYTLYSIYRPSTNRIVFDTGFMNLSKLY